MKGMQCRSPIKSVTMIVFFYNYYLIKVFINIESKNGLYPNGMIKGIDELSTLGNFYLNVGTLNAGMLYVGVVGLCSIGLN